MPLLTLVDDNGAELASREENCDDAAIASTEDESEPALSLSLSLSLTRKSSKKSFEKLCLSSKCLKAPKGILQLSRGYPISCLGFLSLYIYNFIFFIEMDMLVSNPDISQSG